MASFAELPPNAVRRISQLARGRLIEGCNKYARVCKQWRDADFASSSEEEPLQLFMDLQHMSDAEVSTFSTWMSLHGHQVGALVIEANHAPVQHYGQLLASAAALRSITRLEVSHNDSLALLAPVLGQLPQLQCLAAGVNLMQTEVVVNVGLNGQLDGELCMLSVAEEHWQELPNMQQLCPGLQDLRLTIYVCNSQGFDHSIDPRLPELLPCQLQKLALLNGLCLDHTEEPGPGVWLHPSSLVHLDALQQLTLHNIQLADGDLGQHLLGLQELRGHWPGMSCYVLMEPLFQNLVELGCWDDDLVRAMPKLKRLTRLVLTDTEYGEVDELAGLPCLQELCVVCGWRSLGVYATLANLRSLQLHGRIHVAPSLNLAQCLAQYTQLSSLQLSPVHTSSQHGEELRQGLQQLTGLRSLVVPAGWLACDSSTWLLALSQLTCLQLSMSCQEISELASLVATLAASAEGQVEGVHFAEAQRLLQLVQQWPAGLRQVMFWVEPSLSSSMSDGGTVPRAVKRRCWELAPAAPGDAGLQVWLEQRSAAAADWARPFQACPCFPGVWELQGLVGGTSA
jgi:hypothetical protein